jgi:hypothetical protein
MFEHWKVIVASNRAAQHLLRGAAGIAVCAALAGCPQGGSESTSAASTAIHSVAPAAKAPSSPQQATNPGSTATAVPEAPVAGNPAEPADPEPATATPPVSAESQAKVTAVNLSQQSLYQVPMTFGEPFRVGDIPDGNTIVAYAGGRALPTQADIKARNPDGSVRHAVLTVELPSLASGASMPLSLRPVPQASAPGSDSPSLDDVLQSGFDAAVDITIAGQPWHLDARDLLQHASLTRSCEPFGRECKQWVSGPLVSEWVVGGPVLDAQGKANPHIAVYFAVRAYGPAPVSRVRVDVIV